MKKLRANFYPCGNELLKIIAECRAGDEQSCKLLFDLFFGTVVNNILAVYSNFTAEEVEDIVQDTFYQIFTSGIFKYDHARANLSTFFGVIARNTTKKHLSRRKFTQELDPEDLTDNSFLEDNFSDSHEDSPLTQILNDLDEQEQELIRLRYQSEMILEDIAVIFKVDVSTIHRRLKKILKKIRSTQKSRFSE